MRRAMLVSIPLAAMFLAGCPSKPKDGECKTSDDCKEQEGFGKICVEGRCQECGADADCQPGMVCRANKCMPKPECETDGDCGPGKACQDGKCAVQTPECETDAQCGAGQGCEAGKCVAKLSSDDAAAAAYTQCVGADVGPAGAPSVYYDFNRADLDAKARGTLEKVAGCIKSSSVKSLVIEGNCDERGTTEYNLHLGERRAESAKKYLGNLGVGAALRATSFGKEKPVCSESDDSCYSKNRRSDVRPEAGAPRS